MEHAHGHPASRSQLVALSLGALGIVYGDIGTSPLYAVKECFHGLHAIALTQANILGVLSLIFWSLTIVVGVKYVIFIMRADNRGEGGIFALLELLPKEGRLSERLVSVLVFAALAGAALLYGDGIITPAISVLSAVEGLEVATTAAQPFVVPITVLILIGLFMIQKHGTAGIGRIFGPVMIVWFATIGGLGLWHILQTPEVLQAIDPRHAVAFFLENGFHGLIVLGSVVLCITGGEALYADMGHFGRGAIRLTWTSVAFPGLLLNYFGQGAGLLRDPTITASPFYGLVPQVMLLPMVVLATFATVIASQAMISGVFSLTRQAVQLGFIPRVRIIHTSSAMEGQIFIPSVNAALMCACVGLVLAFQESSRLAAAYGIAVTATMAITSLIYYYVATAAWGWSKWKALPLAALFLAFDVTYFGANLLKIFDGGWITLSIAAALVVCMLTWSDGRRLLGKTLGQQSVPMDVFLDSLKASPPHRVPGTAVFLTLSPKGTPVTLLHSFKHHKVLHEKVVLLSIISSPVPLVDDAERVRVKDLGQGFYRMVARMGFMETPNVPEILALGQAKGLDTKPSDTTYFLGRETLLTTGVSPMAFWRKRLFEVMSTNARPAMAYFGIPPGRVVELGVQVEL